MADFGIDRAGVMGVLLAGTATPLWHSELFDRGHGRGRGRIEKFHGKAAPCGRNEPCPCGSGKKYKKCCLPKV